ncbi:MAG: NAD(P)-dependent oxidoreductase [Hyphomicrobiaceae bacterium]|nr:hydroxyacid dehydrogenase [Hyphomicrobiaceae bacterium]
MRPRVLLTHPNGPRTNYYGAQALAELHAIADVTLNQSDDDELSTDRLLALAKDCNAIISDRTVQFDAARLDQLPHIAAILRVAVDIRNIDVPAASSLGILVCQASRSWVPAVAELVIGLMIDAARGISRANLAYKQNHTPSISTGRQLAGSTVGIIGYGPLGQRVADLCTAFGMTVLVHDPYTNPTNPAHVPVTLEYLCATADFIVPLAVATPETENLINATKLALMRPTAYLINLSRGNLIHDDALRAALDSHTIAGAALDVGRAPDQMPMPDLAARINVTATPHIGGLTVPAIEGQALETVAQLRTLLAGQVPPGAVNAPAAHRLQQLRRV